MKNITLILLFGNKRTVHQLEAEEILITENSYQFITDNKLKAAYPIEVTIIESIIYNE